MQNTHEFGRKMVFSRRSGNAANSSIHVADFFGDILAGMDLAGCCYGVPEGIREGPRFSGRKDRVRAGKRGSVRSKYPRSQGLLPLNRLRRRIDPSPPG